MTIGEANGSNIDSWGLLKDSNLAVEAAESVNQLSVTNIPQLELALLASDEDFVDVRVGMHDRCDFERLIFKWNLQIDGFGLLVPNFQQARVINLKRSEDQIAAL